MKFITGGGQSKEISPEDLEDVYLEDEDLPEISNKWSQELLDGGGRKRAGVMEVLMYSKAVRIVYVIIICLLLGVMSPYLMAKWGDIEFSPGNHQVTGTCKVKPEFRLDAFPDRDPDNVTESKCHERGACWNMQWQSSRDEYRDTPLCYHRLPSKRALIVDKWYKEDVSNQNGTLSGSPLLGGDHSTVSARVSSDKKGHILVEVGSSIGEGLPPAPGTDEPLSIHAGFPKDCATCGKGKGVFCVDIKTRDDDNYASIARSHLGPVMVSSSLSEMTLYLPSPRVFAPYMDSFMWDGAKHNFTFNLGPSSSQVHLPMVMGQHPDNHWFIIYLDTQYPGEIVISQGSANQQRANPNQQKGPLVTFRTMGGNIKLHVFVGLPEPPLKTNLEVLIEKFQSHLNEKRTVPPYWAHGYHICRRDVSPSNYLKDVLGMQDANIPYDTDCVDELVAPTAFHLNTHYDLSVLSSRNISVLLPQVIQTATESPAPPPACVENSGECIQGVFNQVNVTFPDPFHQQFSNWVKTSYDDQIKDNISHIGVQLLSTFPSNLPVYELLNETCLQPPYVPSSLDIDQDTLCPNSRLPSTNSTLLQHHTGYSKQVIQSFSETISSGFIFSDTFMLGSRGAFLGSSQPSSWVGLNQTLREVLFLGLAGASMISTPVCGTTPPSSEVVKPELLCLRWFQLASFFPSLRSHYTSLTTLPYTYSTRTYQQYVRWSLQTHYKLLPYLHTLQIEWAATGFPAVRPMFLDHPDLPFQPLWSQFKVGRDILVAPVLHPDVDLIPVQLPQGTWYTLNSGNLLTKTGGSIIVHTHLDEIPAFQRGGSILVTHETAYFGLQATLNTSDYTVMAALECRPDPKLMKTCQAEGRSYIGGDSNVLINVNVQSADPNTGAVSIDIDPGVDVDGLNPLGSVELFGLQQGPAGSRLNVTLLGDEPVEATPDFKTDFWYDVDKQTLIVRDIPNYGFQWKECSSGGCQGFIKWQFWSS